MALLLAPGTLRAQYISYAGTQTVFTVSGVVAPIGIAIDAAGNRYIADYASANVTEVSAGGTVSTISSTLLHPNAIAVDSSGTNVYVSDAGNDRVLEIPVAGGSQTTLGSGLSEPDGVAVDSTGNVYIADFNNHRVLKIAAVGGGQTEVAMAPSRSRQGLLWIPTATYTSSTRDTTRCSKWLPQEPFPPSRARPWSCHPLALR